MMLKITESYKTAVTAPPTLHSMTLSVCLISLSIPLTDRGLNWVHGTEYGMVVRAGMRGNDWKEELRDYGVTWQTIENIQKVLDAGYDAVHFDCDAELVDGLPAWDW